jgi:hypothetical protein
MHSMQRLLVLTLAIVIESVAPATGPAAAFVIPCQLRHCQKYYYRSVNQLSTKRFDSCRSSNSYIFSHHMSVKEPKNGKQSGTDSGQVNLFSKAAWVSAELLGNIARTLKGGEDGTAQYDDISAVPISKDEALERLRKEYERSYFISGEMDIDLYSEDCLFAGQPPSASTLVPLRAFRALCTLSYHRPCLRSSSIRVVSRADS